ncbi:MAG: Asp-tRNA(Asn)/Glu-tRNA(Gln) amidotransferase subunit GatB [Opitutales bacterium]
MEFEVVIGLEVHVQLKTNSKMFTSAPYKFGQEPNTLTDPVVLALPGVLPVLNFEAIRKSIKTGMLLGCNIPEITKWDRKNYFYPDSPKNYQLSQFDEPLCLNGTVEIELKDGQEYSYRKVLLTRIHLEEDVGKLTHCAHDSLVDYNRAGTPLIEIVTEPDMYSADEAFAFLTALRNILVFAGISGCDMEKGQMRCDANISIRPVGETTLGTKVELKNLNSISGVKAGIEYEIKRQIKCKKTGEKIIQETRRWDADLEVSQSMRGKEDSHDYRYFPEPDLLPVKVSQELRDEIAKEMVELPFDRQRRYAKDYALAHSITSVLCNDRALTEYFETALSLNAKDPKAIANLLINDLLREISSANQEAEEEVSLANTNMTPANMVELINIIQEGTISKQIAKEVFVDCFKTGKSPRDIVKDKGLSQNSDTGEIETFCKEAIAGNAKAVAQYKEGNEKALNALIGPVMKLSKGKANPAILLETLKKLLA